jgi:hypothetical protein
MLENPVTPTAAPELGTTAHDKAMMAKVDAAAPAPEAGTGVPQRPEHIPEKFWDAATGTAKVEELAKSYAELERARSAAPKAPETPQATPASTDAATAATEAAKAADVDTSKVDFASAASEFAEKGALSSDTYAKLEASGLPREMVDQYIAGQTAIMNTQVTEAYSLAGGETQYGTMLDWAAKNLPADEQAAFDKAVVADPATRKQAITALKAQYTAAVGADPQLLSGRQGAPNAGGYQSRAEVTADMKDPRYKSDPAYRALVASRLNNSTVF